MRIFVPGGDVLLDDVALPKRQVTFPDSTAYGITVSGRVRRAERWAKFSVTFGIRAA
jgi:hypothetical protein